MPHYDLAIIGAGIHGAAVAHEATTRGYQVVVLEQFEGPARATSSKSSKLIHGGLRYLESGQFRLVRECLVERQRLLVEQPDLVQLVPFHIPVYQHTRRGPWLIATGLSLYTLLGGKGFRRIAARNWPHLDGLKTQGLKAVFTYWDAQTDDRKLTERIMKNAEMQGAVVHYRATFSSAQCARNICRIHFESGGNSETLTATAIVNATGPWVNQALQKITPAISPLDIELVQGTHIIVPGKLTHGVYYLEAPHDQRAIFVMPWRGNIMIGTTETPYQGPPENAAPLDTEIDYLLQTWNHYFQTPLTRSAVIDCFSGLRVLPAAADNPFSRSRDTQLHRDPEVPQVLTIYGGKLTSHHHTAIRVARALGLSNKSR